MTVRKRSPWRPGVTAGLVVSLAITAGSVLRAQNADVLRIDTQLVLVDVVVRDRTGAAVRGLGESDFRVLDRGAEQSLAIVESVSGAPDLASVAELPAGAVSNRRNYRGLVQKSATAILIDRLNTPTDAQIRANQRLLEFLEQSDPMDGFALYELGGSELRLLHDFKDDPRRLIEIVRGLEPEPVSLASMDSNGGFEADLDTIGLDRELAAGIGAGNAGFDRKSADFFMNNRVLLTAGALEAIARHMDGLTGRKNVVWLSGLFPFAFDARRRTDLASEVENSTLIRLEEVGKVITDANVALYPVDVRGPGAEGGDVSNIQAHLAHQTGGQYFTGNGVRTAIEAAVDDAMSVYTVGFYPSEPEGDGRFRELRVEVAGQEEEDFEVRHRPGYFGFTGNDPAATRVGLAELLSSPLDATAIGLFGLAAPVADGSGIRVMTVVEAHDLSLRSIGGRKLGVVDVGLAFRAEDDGTIYVLPAEAHSVNLTDAQYANSEAGFVIARVVDTEGRAGSFRIVVQDQATGAAGSVWVDARPLQD